MVDQAAAVIIVQHALTPSVKTGEPLRTGRQLGRHEPGWPDHDGRRTSWETAGP